MRRWHPSAGERRTILVSCSLALVVLTTVRILPLWRAHVAQQRTMAEELSLELQRAEVTGAALPWLRDSLVARHDRYLALAPHLLSGDSPAGVGAALAGWLSGAATGANLVVGDTRLAIDTVTAGGFTRVRIETSLTGDIHGLAMVLLAVERAPLLLRVSRLAVMQPDPGAPPERSEALRTDLVVEGIGVWRRREASP